MSYKLNTNTIYGYQFAEVIAWQKKMLDELTTLPIDLLLKNIVASTYISELRDLAKSLLLLTKRHLCSFYEYMQFTFIEIVISEIKSKRR